jgi:hypothetical protein
VPSFSERRPPGLRRDKVAAIAGVGPTWDTWFGQGRDVKVSAAFLHDVARALRLNAAGHAHPLSLAGHPVAPRGGDRRELPQVPTDLMAGLTGRPAFIKDLRREILTWTAAFAAIFGDPERLARERRNPLWLTFALPSFRSTTVEWESDARRMVGRFRADRAGHPGDPRLAARVAALEAGSDDFRRLWRDHEAPDRDSGIRTIRVAGGADRFATGSRTKSGSEVEANMSAPPAPGSWRPAPGRCRRGSPAVPAGRPGVAAVRSSRKGRSGVAPSACIASITAPGCTPSTGASSAPGSAPGRPGSTRPPGRGRHVPGQRLGGRAQADQLDGSGVRIAVILQPAARPALDDLGCHVLPALPARQSVNRLPERFRHSPGYISALARGQEQHRMGGLGAFAEAAD